MKDENRPTDEELEGIEIEENLNWDAPKYDPEHPPCMKCGMPVQQAEYKFCPDCYWQWNNVPQRRAESSWYLKGNVTAQAISMILNAGGCIEGGNTDSPLAFFPKGTLAETRSVDDFYQDGSPCREYIVLPNGEELVYLYATPYEEASLEATE